MRYNAAQQDRGRHQTHSNRIKNQFHGDFAARDTTPARRLKFPSEASRCLQAVFTSAVYKRRLQAPFTSAVYKRRLQTPFTSAVYKRRLQAPFTSAVYKRCSSPVFTSAVYKRGLKAV